MINLPKTPALICIQEGEIFTITLNRPEKLNAFNEDMFNDLEKIIEIISKLPDIRVIIITGAGNAFSSGGDINEMLKYHRQAKKQDFERHLKRAQSVFDSFAAIPQPTIAAVNGHAVGAGFQITLACDFRIMARDAALGVKDVKIGIIPALGATTRLSELVGLSKAKELVMIGDLIDSNHALSIGLANFVVDKNSLKNATLKFAKKLISNAPLAVSAAKNLLNSNAPLAQVAKVQINLFKTDDAGEGIASFIEKRVPSFKGA